MDADERMQILGGMCVVVCDRAPERPSSDLTREGGGDSSTLPTVELLVRLAESPRTTSM